MKTFLQHFIYSMTILHEVDVDLKGSHGTITNLHEQKDYGLYQTVHCLRGYFGAEDPNRLHLVQGQASLADILTKKTCKCIFYSIIFLKGFCCFSATSHLPSTVLNEIRKIIHYTYIS